MFLALLVFIGSGIGGTLRYGVNLASARWLGADFPWGTFAVNVAGSFIMGAVAAFFFVRSGQPGTAEWRLFLTTGILGGFTTFSAFTLDTIYLWERGETLAAVAYVVGSVLISLAALFAGLWLVRALAG